MFRFAVEEFYSNVDHAFIGEFQKKLYDENSQKIDDVLHTDYDRIAGYIWENRFFTDEQRLDRFLSEEHTLEEYLGDPLFRFLQEVKITEFNNATSAAEGKINRVTLNKEFTHALYQMRLDKGIVQ